MLSIEQVSLYFGDRAIFDGISVQSGEYERIGVVGRNGAGKTTLFELIAGRLDPDEGQVSLSKGDRVGMLEQEIKLDPDKNIQTAVLEAEERTSSMRKEIERLEHQLAHPEQISGDKYEKIIPRLNDLHHQYNALGGDQLEGQVEKILLGLGFEREQFDQRIGTLSGGWLMRVELAKLLLRQPEYLLLDEPTNHLDIHAIIWLEEWLKQYEGTVLLISHDKTMLETLTQRIWDIERGNLYDYKMSYDDYVVEKEERLARERAAYENQQKVIKEKQKTIDKFRENANKASMAQSMIKQLEKMDKIELTEVNRSKVKLRFPEPPRSGQTVVKLYGIGKKYDDWVFRDVDLQVDRGDRLAFVGQNGMGKTTMVKILNGDLSCDEGQVEWGHNIEIGYYAQVQSSIMDSNQTVKEYLASEIPDAKESELRSVLGAFLFSGEEVHKRVGVLSGGERARLALAALVMQPCNFLMLDEPTNHLDIETKQILKDALKSYEGTLILVSHDRSFLQDLTDKTIEFREHSTHEYLGDIREFFRRREADNFREVEAHKSRRVSEEQSQSYEGKESMSYEERKQIKNQIRKAERKVDELEERIAEREKEMADPSFYEQEDGQKALEEYVLWKKHRDEWMERWESMMLQLED